MIAAVVSGSIEIQFRCLSLQDVSQSHQLDSVPSLSIALTTYSIHSQSTYIWPDGSPFMCLSPISLYLLTFFSVSLECSIQKTLKTCLLNWLTSSSHLPISGTLFSVYTWLLPLCTVGPGLMLSCYRALAFSFCLCTFPRPL